MTHRGSLRSHATASIWTTLVAIALIITASSWVTVTSISAQAADPKNILLDFSATWCGPCQQMSPLVARLERAGYPIRKVDVDQEKGLAQKYNVETIPCFVLIANGREINRIVGATDEKTLKSLMMMLPKDEDPSLAANPASRKNGNSSAEVKTASRSSDDRKLLPRIPPLFAKAKPAKQDSVAEPETIRLQNADQDSKADAIAQAAYAASTRIRVKDGSQVHYGSGTVIDSQPGRGTILTCAHILRNLGKKAVIEVDLFTEGRSKPQVAVAEIVEVDKDADVALLSIPCQQRLSVVTLASAPGVPQVEDRVFSIGCGGGKLPTLEEHVVKAINGCVGPDNLECTGIPQQGRSGGGLFRGSEQVGVCILADPNYKRGIYTGMKPVAQLLAKAGLGHLMPNAVAAQEALAEVENHSDEAVLGEPELLQAERYQPETPINSNEPAQELMAEVEPDSVHPADNAAFSASDYVGAEIVCTIRPKTPGAPTRVVIINQATSRFVDDLLHDSSVKKPAPRVAVTQNSRPTQVKAKQSQVAASSPQRRGAKSEVSVMESAPRNQRAIETSFETRSNSRN